MASQITKTEFLALYESGELHEAVNSGTRIYGRIHDEAEGYKVVWCNL